LDRAILAGVRANIEHYNALRALTSADARPTPENQQGHQDRAEAVVELQRVAEQHLAVDQPAPEPPPPQRNSRCRAC
jgi:hypothetical protein